MAAISLRKLNKHYGSLFHAVKDVDLEIADKEFVALVGPSGCGKSTTLRMIAGLEDISSGEILIGGKVVSHLPPRDRDVAMVFQNYALYQHMSVYDNLAFGLRNKRVAETEIKVAIDRAADMLGLHELLQRKPRQLSGGQQQRVALGRCIVRNPQVFLFDEPLSNLDAKLRARMRIEIKRLHAQIPTTSVFVTHDQIEAMTLGDRVVIMRDGIVQQIGTPLAVYEKPANKFVAGFIGAPAMNFVDVAVRREPGGMAVESRGLKISVNPAEARAMNPITASSSSWASAPNTSPWAMAPPAPVSMPASKSSSSSVRKSCWRRVSAPIASLSPASPPRRKSRSAIRCASRRSSPDCISSIPAPSCR